MKEFDITLVEHVPGAEWAADPCHTGQDAHFGQIERCNVIVDERPKDHTVLVAMSGPAVRQGMTSTRP